MADRALYAWTKRSKVAHIAAGGDRRVACMMGIKAELFKGTDIPPEKRLCRRCDASQGNTSS